MGKFLPFGLLIPAVLLLGFFVASQFGFALPFGSPTSTLLGAIAWFLLFLIIYGHVRGWRLVRVFLVVFVVGKFSAIFYHQLTDALPIGRLLLRLAGAAVIAWLMFGFFWPRKARAEKPSDSNALDPR